MRCPRCADALSLVAAGDAPVLACAACGGVWMDGPTAHRFAEALHGEHPAVQAARSAAEASLYDLTQLDDLLCCPVCEGALRRFTHEASGVELDTCGVHGIWFDRHELERAVQSPQQSGDAIDQAVSDSSFTGAAWVVADVADDVQHFGGVDLLGDVVVGAAELAGSMLSGAVDLLTGVFSD